MTNDVNVIPLGPFGVWRAGKTEPDLAVEIERLGW
jgi:hypothetical protein